jgi:hypothetical protein
METFANFAISRTPFFVVCIALSNMKSLLFSICGTLFMLKVRCESYANPMIYPLIAYGITIVALALVTRAVRQLLTIYKKGQPDPTRGDIKNERLANMLKETLGHTKMLNFSVTGVAHGL